MNFSSRNGRETPRAAEIAGLAIGIAMIVGGGGSPAPLPELALQLMMALLFGAWLVLVPSPPRAPLRTALGLAALFLTLPILQLIPLPPSLWHALPGRELERASLQLIGEDATWRPWSLAPARTLASLAAMVPPAMVLVLVGTLRPSGRTKVIGMIASVSMMAILVGAAQAAGGPDNIFRFYAPDTGYLNGFQANHNSAADVLLIGMVAFAVIMRELDERRRSADFRRMAMVILATGTAVMSLGVFLTASRAGTALLVVAWGFIFALTASWWKLPRKSLILAVVVGLAGAVAVALTVRYNQVLAMVVERYDFSGEFRPELWVDALYAARLYFPFGAGLGSFNPVFVAIERLEVVDTTIPNRAHNDYLELAIEGGLFGLLLLVLAVRWLTRAAIAGLRDETPAVRRQTIFACAVIAIIALHSQVDYPLRSMSLACLAAAAAGLLVPSVRLSRGRDVRSEI